LQPGESTVLSLAVRAPEKPGNRVLVVDLADEGVGWFRDRGSQALSIPLRVFWGAGQIGGLMNKLTNQH
jgi:hypothetical protein